MKTPGLLLLLSILLFSTVLAGERIVIGGLNGVDPHSATEPAQVKLALSGGGARGLVTIGVLRAFEERGIRISAIAGTSIGGVLGGLYASGYSADDLEDIIRDINFDQLLRNQPSRRSMFLTKRQVSESHIIGVRFSGLKPTLPRALTTGQEVSTLLITLTNRANYLARGEFENLPIPFKTVATDVVDGSLVVLDSGSLANAMRATIAFPLALTGIDVGDRLLVDGGMVMPVPVEVVRQMGDTTDFVVAINTTSPLQPRSELDSPFEIANQATSIMTADKLERQLELADYVIEPGLPWIAGADFRYYDTLLAVGYNAGQKAADEIHRRLRCNGHTARYTVNDLRVETTDRALADQISTVFLNKSFTREQLLDALKQFALTHDLLQLTIDIDPPAPACVPNGNHGKDLALTVEPVPTLPNDTAAINFAGNTIFTDAELHSAMDLTDDKITRDDLSSGVQNIKQLYERSGYDLASVRDIRFDSDADVIHVIIDEAIIQRIDVDNNERTKDWLVRSYFPLETGKPYSTDKAADGLGNIYSTDLFERVTLDLEPADSGLVLHIGVVERKYSQIRFGWHWHDQYESEQFIEFLDDNMLGIGMEWLTHVQYGIDRRHYYTDLRAHRIFHSYLTSQIRGGYQRVDRVIYNGEGDDIGSRNDERFYGTVRFGQQLARLGLVTGGLLIEHVTETDRRTGRENEFGLRSLVFQSSLETFDRMPFPVRGEKLTLELQLAGQVLGGEVEFTRFFGSAETYLPIGKYLTYHPKASLGLSRSGLPPTEQFYIGGMHSFAGFRYDQLSGDKMILLNQELRLKLPLWSYLYARYDVGEVYSSGDDIKLRNLRHGFGFAFAVDTPIGPFEIGYGQADSDNDQVYFNAGFEF